MNVLEQSALLHEDRINFGMEGFDFDAAFQGAISDVATNEELALDEKVQRMEVIIQEASSELYTGFVDFTNMAAQMEMMCSHDHGLREAIEANETLSGFLDTHKTNNEHTHDPADTRSHVNKDKEVDPRTGKKRKKKKAQGFLESLFKKYRNHTAHQAGRFSLFS